MATLVIPDVHERFDRLSNALVGRMEKASRIVFLGDWFDAFGGRDLDRLGEICAFINANHDGLRYEDRVIPTDWLLGNHDCHYFFQSNGFKCSGYDPVKHNFISANIPDVVVDSFKIFTKVGPYTLSHAGFHEATLQYCRPEVEREALKTVKGGGWDPIFGAGRARGGSQMIGGPTWLDWNSEFEHIPEVPQIVGHTHGSAVRTKGVSTGDSTKDRTAMLSFPWACKAGASTLAFGSWRG